MKGQAFALNSLAQVLSQQKKFELAIHCFQQSIKIGQEINNDQHLAKAYTAMGKSFLQQKNYKNAAEALKQSFEIYEKCQNKPGLVKVTLSLCSALRQLNERDKAIEYCDRALAVKPKEEKLLKRRKRLSLTQLPKKTLKRGVVKKRFMNEPENFHGYITPDDGTKDIIFHQRYIDDNTFLLLKPGIQVEVEVKYSGKNVFANKIKLI